MKINKTEIIGSSSLISYSEDNLLSTNYCDTIFKKDGTFILAQTVLIHSKTLIYKNCGDNSTKNQTISRDEVFYFVNSTTGKTYLKNDICDTIFKNDGTFILAKMVRIHKGIVQYKKCDGSSNETEYVYSDECTHFKNSKNQTTLISIKICDTLSLKNGNFILAKMVRVKNDKILYKKCDGSSTKTEEIYIDDLKSKTQESLISRSTKILKPWTLAFLMCLFFTFIVFGALAVGSFTSPFLSLLAFFLLIATLATGLTSLFIHYYNK